MIGPPGLHGYRMPAEWAPHRATWIAWPHNAEDWPGKFPPIPWAYGELVRVLSGSERVRILVQNGLEERRAAGMLRKIRVDLKRVDFFRIPTDRVWTRDSGAIFIKHASGARVATHWKFNGWAKYPNHRRDDQVAHRIAEALRVPEYPVIFGGREIVMEGGAIDVDGSGTLLATEECLLSRVQARNPGLGRKGIETVFHEVLGIDQVIWLGRGIAGDDTHGHIDDLARFVAPGQILLCQEHNPKDPNYRILRENRERLQSARDARGRRLNVVLLPMPAPIIFDGMRVPASYANFYIANEVVVVPTFNDPQDRIALGLLSDLFPHRSVVGIHCVDFVWGLGTLHCATQQEPS
jgi:agmatine deiminase